MTSKSEQNDVANCVIPPICEPPETPPTTGNNNSNSNENENSNENANQNQNANANCNSNTNSNEVENEITNKVNTTVDVNVKVDADISTGHSAPAIDLSHFYGYDTVVIADTGNQTINGGGNAFHLDQVNNLVNNGYVDNPTVTFDNGGGVDCYGQWHPGGDFHMEATASSGNASSSGGTVGDVIGAAANGIVSHADATVTQSAFDQTITTGANIQFNSLTMSVAGHDYSDSHNLGHS
jgi:hypothetical protein